MPSTSTPTESWLGALGDVFDRRVNETLANRNPSGSGGTNADMQAGGALLLIVIDNFADLQLLDAAHHVRGIVGLAGQRVQAIIDPLGGHWAPMAQNQLRAFLPDVKLDEVDALALHLQSALSAAYTFADKPILVTFSVSVAVSPAHGQTVQTLTRNALLAMHGSREPGVSTYRLFDEDTISAAKSERELEQDLRQLILAHDMSQFELAYQRLSRCSDGQCIGGEALLRWRHPRLGIVPTEGFIIMAERSGLIVEMGVWVLEQACRQASAWPEHWKVHVNVSVEQLRRADFVEQVVRALDVSGLPGTRLGLELTETLHIAQYDALAERLSAVRALGVSVVLDDFGSGYSSLNHLQKLPLDCIKLDALFAAEIETSARARAVIQAMVGMAHALDLEVVAEGVETAGQHHVLCELGCDSMQGYLLGRPMTAADLLAGNGDGLTMS